eukprot:CAMPEP_0181308452 /NCGR_PEP_ID=MMETSP1101-20121128/11470_1 /TAXON_ID=46948 /ORGANISM="Rhodomonas abbreviata, Strain Caron Lab Isolate" /LENGTH=445 /DNA_ID=CAMNT_0023414835 /DNA_START=22 /DNA_END=1359 /DNA_ORIENTATION=-
MISYFIGVVAIANVLSSASAAYCNGSPDEGERTNDFPIFDEELTYIRSVKNAKLYEAGPANARFPVVHVWGTPYEVGFAQGTLMKPVIKDFVGKTWKYLSEELTEAMDGDLIPEFAKKIITQKGMDRALDWTAEVTAPFTPQAYFDEVQGLADATGISYDLLYRVNMFPELTKASCSFFGAWGNAVGNTGHSYQLRALDFDTDGPFKDFPQVTVYHPSEGNAYAQVSWPGNVGLLSGFSEQQLAISEIGVTYPDDSFGQGTENTPPEKVHGEPWMYVLRDVLQFEDTLEAAEKRISDSNRTCNLIIGVGDGKSGAVNGIEYSGYVAVPYDDQTLLPVNDTWHPIIDDVVYNGMDWNCPSYTSALGEQLTKFYGAISEVNTISDVLPTVQTGDLHAAVYDLTDSKMHISFCRKANADESEPHYAYERQFTRLHMKDVFAVAAPTDV